jgi:glutathione synthase/RimK-type ligase-like ATP-grasp enzyme
MSKKHYKSKGIREKFKVYQYLVKDYNLKKHLPHTTTFTKENLEKMITQYSTLYVKPNIGSHGNGISKIIRTGHRYKLRSGNQTKMFASISSLYQSLASRSNKKMIIQQGITLEKAGGRPYDIRAMVQRKPNESWTCTGIFTKVGYPNRIVTNYYQGGQLYTMDKVFKKMNVSSTVKKSRMDQLTECALNVTRVLSAKRTGMSEMGIDFAYDTEGQLWIIEVNSNQPQFYPLKKVDRTMYNRMISFARSYGRKSG